MNSARGLRNKNPLNIIKSDVKWQGEVRPSTDSHFAQFETMEYGLRAAMKLLRTYYERHARRTVRLIVGRWAPETENNVNAYVSRVCRLTGLAADVPLPPMKSETRVVWCDLVLAMATVECALSTKEREELAPLVARAWTMAVG